MSGPLAGLRVLELGGIGPGPHAAMLLADLGADVVRVDRPSGGLKVGAGARDWMQRNRRRVAADMKTDEGMATMKALFNAADVVIEGFRPGVAERLGIGPADFAESNPGLIYARMTGWGQDGPWAKVAGHDINYISVTGALKSFQKNGSGPVPPLNFVGDFGGGSMFLVLGILAALYERQSSGRGQVIDAGIVDGTTTLAQMVWGLMESGTWVDQPASNLLDTACPFYDTYQCSDGEWMAVGALEPQFYAELLKGLGLDAADLPRQNDRSGWPVLREKFTEIFASRTRDEWAKVFEGTDACTTPVLSWGEAAAHPHLVGRRTIIEVDGVPQAAPSPRFSRSEPDTPVPPPVTDTPLDEVLASWQR
jgi:alpha-methylacyl-CoA racemase